MPIDWFTVVAQAINFLILVAVLARFLYRPVVEAMDAREARIASRLEEAEERRGEAERRAERLDRERSELDQRREEILEEARTEGEERREAILDEARERADRLAREWRQELERRGDAMAEELVGRLVAQLVRSLERAFDELADERLQERILAAMVERLGSLPTGERRELASALRDEVAEVRSAEELDEEQRGRIREAIESIARPAEMRFRRDESLIRGIELRVGGRRVAWSLRAYVRALETAMRDAIEGARRDGEDGDEVGAGAERDGERAERSERQGDAEAPASERADREESTA